MFSDLQVTMADSPKQQHTFDRFHCEDSIEVDDEERIALKYTEHITNEDDISDPDDDTILIPYGTVRIIWDTIVLCLISYSVVEIPFTVSFRVDLDLQTWPGVISLIIDCLLLLDILLNFRTAFYSKLNPLNFQTSPSEIAKNYCFSWFFLDLFTSIPWEILLPSDYSAIRMIKMLRIFRLLRSLNVLKRFQVLSEFFVHMIGFILSMLLTIHFVACIWFFVGRQSLKQYEESWVRNEERDLLDSTKYEQYIKSIYFSVVTLFTLCSYMPLY